MILLRAGSMFFGFDGETLYIRIAYPGGGVSRGSQSRADELAYRREWHRRTKNDAKRTAERLYRRTLRLRAKA